MNIDQKILYLAVIWTKFVTSFSFLAGSSVEKTYFEDVSDYSHLFRGVGVIPCSNPRIG